MGSRKERDTFVYLAKVSEKAERYKDMVESMKNVAKLNVDMTVEERNLLSVGYKNVIGSTRGSSRRSNRKKQRKGMRLM